MRYKKNVMITLLGINIIWFGGQFLYVYKNERRRPCHNAQPSEIDKGKKKAVIKQNLDIS